jgi:hypothetical protein
VVFTAEGPVLETPGDPLPLLGRVEGELFGRSFLLGGVSLTSARKFVGFVSAILCFGVGCTVLFLSFFGHLHKSFRFSAKGWSCSLVTVGSRWMPLCRQLPQSFWKRKRQYLSESRTSNTPFLDFCKGHCNTGRIRISRRRLYFLRRSVRANEI